MKWLHISRYTDDQCTGHSLLGNIYISHHFHNSTKYLLRKGVKVPLRYSKIQCFFFFFKENCSFNLSKAVTGREERNRRHLIFCILVEMMRNDRLSLRHLIWPELRKILRQQYPDYNFFSETSNYHVHSNNLWNKWNWFAFHLIGYLFASARDEIVGFALQFATQETPTGNQF